MPTLVNYGDDSMCPKSLLAYSTHKRSRLNSYYRGVEKKLRLEEEISLDSLPDECLYEILRRLPGNQERSNSACVSKRWLMLLSGIKSSDLLMDKKPTCQTKKQSLDVNVEDAENHDDEEVEDIFENFGCLTRSLKGNEVTNVKVSAMAVCTSTRGGLGKLVICGSHPTRGLTDVGLSSISRCCPGLKSLSILNVPSVTDAGLSELAGGCPLLERLDLSYCSGITTQGLIAVAEKCSNLASLTLDRCVNIGNDGIHAIARSCPKLHSVSIKHCDLIGDEGISKLMSSASATLTRLKLQNLNITDISLAFVGHFGRAVTELHLNQLNKVAEKGFWCMGQAKGLSKLQTVIVTSCHGLTDAAIDALGKASPNLKNLVLRNCCNVSDNGLIAFIKKSDGLQLLQLEECHSISLFGVLYSLVSPNSKLNSLSVIKCMGVRDTKAIEMIMSPTVASSKSLNSLTIRDCPLITDISLAVVGQLCPNLTHLEITNLAGITDTGLLPILTNNDVGLIKANLKGCVNLTDVAIVTLLKQHGDTLQALNIGGLKMLTDRVLYDISRECTLLEELDVSGADITDYGVALLASARHLSFSVLSFSGCLKLSVLSLPLLGNMGTSLVGLNLQHCNITIAKGMSALEEKLYWCDILY